jgi:hypothetical protein
LVDHYYDGDEDDCFLVFCTHLGWGRVGFYYLLYIGKDMRISFFIWWGEWGGVSMMVPLVGEM